MDTFDSWLGRPRPTVDTIVNDYREFLTFRDTLEEHDTHDHTSASPHPLNHDATFEEHFCDDHPLKKVGRSVVVTYSEVYDGTTSDGDEIMVEEKVQMRSAAQPASQMPGTSVKIGGITMKKPSLIIGDGVDRYANMPVMLLAVDRRPTNTGVLLMTPPPARHSKYTRSAAPTSTPPVLLLSSETPSDMKVDGPAIPESRVGDALAATAGQDVATTKVAAYVLEGDVDKLFGVPGLVGKLYKFQTGSEDGEDPVLEKVVPKRGKIQDKRLASVLPFLDVEALGNSALSVVGDNLAKLPDMLKKIEFVYSEDDKDYFFEPGLRVEADVEFNGPLQPVADALKNMFNTSKTKNVPPEKVRLSAHLTKTREDRWAKRPQPKVFTLRGHSDMTLWAGEILNFTRIGVELRFKKLAKSSDDGDDDKADGEDDGGEDEADGDAEGANGTKTDEDDTEVSIQKETKKKPGKPTSAEEDATSVASKKRQANGHVKAPNGTATVTKDGTKAKSKNQKAEESEPVEDDVDGAEGEEKEEGEDEGDDADDGKEVKEKKKLTVGFGIFGEVDIYKIPCSTVPLHAKYRIRKLGSEYELKMDTDEWKGAFGLRYLTIKNISFLTTFDSSKFKESFKATLTANMTLGKATIDLTGELASEETYLEGEVKDMSWNDMVSTYYEIMGRKLPSDLKGNDLKFQDLKLRIGTKGVSFHGEATFNGKSSAEATVSFDGDGLTVVGKLANFKVESTDIEIKEAHLDIFVGRKEKKADDEEDKVEEDDDKDKQEEDADESEKEEGKSDRASFSGTEGAIAEERALAALGRPRLPKSKDESDDTNTATAEGKDQDDADKTEGEDEKAVKFKGRESRFAIGGEVDFAELKILVGFHFSNTKEKGKQWIAYGALKNTIQLSSLAPELRNTWLDIALDQPALIAASHAMEEDNDIIPLKYSVSKGIQFCANIKSIDQLNKMAGREGEETLGYRLVACMSGAKLAVSLHMPDSFAVQLSEAARIGDFNVGVQISKTPGLNVGGNLMLTLKEQKQPLKFVIELHADILGMGGSVRCDTKWVNPFGISDKVAITAMAGELEFLYATIAAGPSKFAVEAAGEAGKIHAAVAFSISQKPDQQVLSVKLDNLNIGEIIQFVGEANNIYALKQFPEADFLVFAEANLYLSTGGSIAGKEFPAGMSASGRLVVFGKTASFNASVTTNGLVFLVAVDQFDLGPLQVRSASGAEQAKLDIEVTKDKQRLEIDGMVKLLNVLEVKTLIKAQLNPIELEALISIHFGDILTFDLEAHVKNVSDVKNLANVDVYFRAEFNADILGKFCDALEHWLTSIADSADQDIDAMELKLTNLMHDLQVKIATCDVKLKAAREKAAAAESQRDRTTAEENKKIDQARKELEALQKKVDNARDKNSAEIRSAKRQLDNAQRERDELIERKRIEYGELIRKNEAERREIERQKKALQDHKHVKFGDAIRDLDNAQKEVDKAWSFHRWQKSQAEKTWAEFQRADFWGRIPLWVKVCGENEALNNTQSSLNIATGILNLCKGVVRSAEFLRLDEMINNEIEKYEKTAFVISALTTKGMDGFVAELVRDRAAEAEEQRRKYDALLNNNSVYGRVLEAAMKELNDRRPGIEARIANADRAIVAAKNNKRVKDLVAEREALQSERRRLEVNIKNVTHILEDIRKGIRTTVNAVVDVLHAVKDITIRVKRVLVEVDATNLKKGGKLLFEIDLVVFGMEKKVHVEFKVTDKPQDFFMELARKAMELATDTGFAPVMGMAKPLMEDMKRREKEGKGKSNGVVAKRR